MLSFLSHYGTAPPGDSQAVSNIDAEQALRLYELRQASVRRK